MAIIQSDSDNAHVTGPHHNKEGIRVRSITEEDGALFDKKLAKTLVRLPDGTDIICWNTELQPSPVDFK